MVCYNDDVGENETEAKMGLMHRRKQGNPERQKKMSIRQQISILFIINMLFVVLACWFINATFLEKFYLWNKEEAMNYA